MRTHIASVALILLAGCQASEENSATLAAADDGGDVLASFESDAPCGWDDPLVFNDLPEDPGDNHQRCTYFDDGAEEDAVIRHVNLSIYADGTARVGYEPMAGGIEIWDATWTRVDGKCAIEVSSIDGELLTYLGNPDPTGESWDPGFYDVTFLGSDFEGVDNGVNYSCTGSESGF